MSRFRRPLPTSPDDPRLLEVTTSLGQQLDIPNLNIGEIRWMAWIPSGRSSRLVPSDWCLFMRHAIVMPYQMMGKLTVEEWRPLIASSVLYEKRLRKRLRSVAFLTGLIPLFALALLVSLAILFQAAWLISLFIVVLIPAIIVGSSLYNPRAKKVRLEADTEASQVTGKEVFLGVLRKIDGMGLSDVDRLKAGKRVRGSAAFPTITTRIENLQGFPSNPNSYTSAL